jgi:hypothetical protein
MRLVCLPSSDSSGRACWTAAGSSAEEFCCCLVTDGSSGKSDEAAIKLVSTDKS